MNLQEAKTKAEATGTAGVKKFRIFIRNGIIAISVIIVLVVSPFFFIHRQDTVTATTAPAPVAVAPIIPCLERVCSVTLTPNQSKQINPDGYYVYPRVDYGSVELSGPGGSMSLGPDGADFQPYLVTTVQADGGGASMRYILCPGPKTKEGMSRWDCS
ncbi:MAG TPA: hypothetical protein VHD31_03275 [Candidatus Paceibacterota bacterium]|nr:hypothetical protein [Candidatus Paceibacterota bacterium]